jgi:hypothetical protein
MKAGMKYKYEVGVELVELSKRLEKDPAAFKASVFSLYKQEAISLLKDYDPIINDIKKKKTPSGLGWTCGQYGLSIMGLKVIK